MNLSHHATAEDERLHQAAQRSINWQRWGPYLSERQWGTVREDYSADGRAWNYLTHDHARSRAYRWGEDGLMGICDRECRVCFAVALWNGRDPILKERLFGLGGLEGNHGEDVKECYYYLDSTPTHSYMKALYKYPHARFPYERLVDENRRRDRNAGEFELEDTEIFANDRYFDVFVEYAKQGADDILIRIQVGNRGPQAAVLHVLPQIWFRNTWIWGCDHEGCGPRPNLRVTDDAIQLEHPTLGRLWLQADSAADGSRPAWITTENETNPARHPGLPTWGEYFKDGFHRYVIEGDQKAVHPQGRGTKAAPYYLLVVPPGVTQELRLRLHAGEEKLVQAFGEDFANIFEQRIVEADAYYTQRIPAQLSADQQLVMRQAYAGLLWTKQFYHYIVNSWIKGDPEGPPAPPGRGAIRNGEWPHLFNRDIICMPDKWEYPWYAAWDSAFHMIPMCRLDPHFAKDQLLLFLREWYMHPNGQIPAYEWQLSDVNPPVHAWSCWSVYEMTGPPGSRDRKFLTRTFHKLLLNFTWWVNRKDPQGRHVFTGGFLGLDNIGVFDRSKPLHGGYLEQADGTAWMAFYCGVMLQMALELALTDDAYDDLASKFFEHYIAIADAMNSLDGFGLWNEQDGFYYDHLYIENRGIPMRIRSLVGLIPLLSAVILEDEEVDQLSGFRKRMDWFVRNRSDLIRNMSYLERQKSESAVGLRLLSIPSEARFRRLLAVMLDEKEFLSPFGIRSLSAFHLKQPFIFDFEGQRHEVRYVPGESDSPMFGGNSNWRGPIWFPINFLIIEALKKYHRFYGDQFRVECPTGSGQTMTLLEVAHEIERRLINLFAADVRNRRPCHGDSARYCEDPHWKDLVLFYEYFHGDDGRGLGANHQTGWTALVAELLLQQAKVIGKATPM